MNPPDTFSGRTIGGKYAVRERLGAGGMGAVYRAEHLQTGGDVAIKFLHGTGATDANLVKRFELEARNSAQLRHANTIRVTDFGMDPQLGALYLVMEYLKGRSLARLLDEEGAQPWPRVVHILRQVLMSLWEAHEHERKIVHRDIKPANIMLVDLPGVPDHVKVLDFGIARSLTGTGAGTQGLIGTPFFMAPELWRGESVDARTDLYALGCVAFQLLAGVPPFQAPPSAADVMLPLLSMHCNDAPPRVSEVAPGVPETVGAWVENMLVKDKAGRPASARQALALLDAAVDAAGAQPRGATATALAEGSAADAPVAATHQVVTGVPSAASPAATVAGTRRSRLPWIIGGVAAAALVGVGIYVAASGSPTSPAALFAPPPTQGSSAAAPTADPEQAQLEALVEAFDQQARIPEGQGAVGELLFTYRARLGARDHADRHGQRHASAAAIVVEDRANYHHFNLRDREDQGDPAFGNTDALEAFEDLIEEVVDPLTAHSIITGTPLVEIKVFEMGASVRVVGR